MTLLCTAHQLRLGAAATCERCGSYFCPSCAPSPVFCAGCYDRSVVPWEAVDHAFWPRLRRTWALALLHPSKLAAQVRHGGLRAPFVFALLQSSALCLPLLVEMGWGGIRGAEPHWLVIVPAAMTAFLLGQLVLFCSIFASVARLAGRRGLFQPGLRACLYVSAWYTPLGAVLMVPALARATGRVGTLVWHFEQIAPLVIAWIFTWAIGLVLSRVGRAMGKSLGPLRDLPAAVAIVPLIALVGWLTLDVAVGIEESWNLRWRWMRLAGSLEQACRGS